jgi:hypothetical protein
MNERRKGGSEEPKLTEEDLQEYFKDIEEHPYFSAHPNEVFPVVNEAEKLAVGLRTGLDLTLYKFYINDAGLERLLHEQSRGNSVDPYVLQILAARRDAAFQSLETNTHNVFIRPEPFQKD